ncbi:hypothetical protein QOZ80_4BG0353730 [Eleusine coracana subsp. coracana]|nr:hypothetical protein QOZ80_4BG0353730 [Eleusine coracana subsp. coracana]
MKMKIIAVVVILIIFTCAYPCVQNQVEGGGTYKEMHGKESRKLINIDGRTAPSGDNSIDHICPLGSYPC